jgi:hypothetical protein
MDYTDCLRLATSEFTARSNFEWKQADGVCTLRFKLNNMHAPVFIYYSLTNFYQNHRYCCAYSGTSQLIKEKE